MAKEAVVNNEASMIRRAVVDQGLATADEVHQAQATVQQLNEQGKSASLGEVLVQQGLVTARQLKRVLDQIRESQSSQIPGYEILDKLGAGAMAAVFKARQISLDRMVAIKVLPRKYNADANFIARFYAEGRAAAKLNHPNIVQAFDVNQAGDYHYFVMEYVEGATVFDVLQEKGRYEEKEGLRVIIAIAEALKHAHDKGFIHRDVKPKNIMITKQGVPKLADMGLARSVSDKQAAEAEAGKAFGTPYYISPEQIRGEKDVDFRADIYGLGATFYHMLTGRVPFDGPNPSAVMHKHLREELVPPDHLNPKLSAGVSEVVEKMMAKDKSQRYASTAALLDDLRAVAAGQAPPQARKKINLNSLADIERQGAKRSEVAELRVGPSLFESPIFWVMIGSIIINIILLFVMLNK
jgi:serine/threonine-protein kinase